MSRPVARKNDPVGPAGKIIQGCPTVLAGGQPVARVNDATGCLPHALLPPLNVPHPGFIVGPGSPTVQVGGSTIAAQLDVTLCMVIYPNVVKNGCPDVLVASATVMDYVRLLAPDWDAVFNTIFRPWLVPILYIDPKNPGGALWVKTFIAFNSSVASAWAVAVGAAVVVAVVVGPVWHFSGVAAEPPVTRLCSFPGGVDAFMSQERVSLLEEDGEPYAAMYLL